MWKIVHFYFRLTQQVWGWATFCCSLAVLITWLAVKKKVSILFNYVVFAWLRVYRWKTRTLTLHRFLSDRVTSLVLQRSNTLSSDILLKQLHMRKLNRGQLLTVHISYSQQHLKKTQLWRILFKLSARYNFQAHLPTNKSVYHKQRVPTGICT